MDGRIPDFGRGSVDPLKHAAAHMFKKKEAAPAKLMSALDAVDLTSALDPQPAKKKWTVLLYLDGNNSLYGPAYEAMKSLEKLGSNRDVNLVVELGANPGEKSHGGLTQIMLDAAMAGKKVETVKRYLVAKDASDSDTIQSPELQDLGKQDMGDPKVVSDFLKWGIQSYPAEHYAVVLFNHGAGFAGVLSDENTGSLLTTKDMKQVVDEAAAAAGHKVDVLDFDACLMAQAEVGNAVKDGARYMVASEETERGMAQPLSQIMKDLQEGSQAKAMDPADLARMFVYESFHQPEGAILTSTLSAVDLQKLDPLAQSAARLSQAVQADGAEASRIRKDIANTESFCQGLDYKLYNDYHDLGHFARLLQGDDHIQNAAVKAAAADVLQSVNDAVVAEEHSGKRYADTSGISTYLPRNYGFDPRPHTDSVNFAKAHDYEATTYAHDARWSDMLKSLTKDTKWHGLLKTVGMQKEGIDALDRKLHLAGGLASGLAKLTLSIGGLDGKWQALQAVKHGAPSGFLMLGSTDALKLGALGGAYEIVKGVRDMHSAFQDKAAEGISDVLMDSRTRKVNAGLTIAEGLAMTTVNAGMLLGLSAGLTTAAGVLALALPAAKIIYDAVHITHNLKEKAEEMQHPPQPSTASVNDKLTEVAAQNGHLVR